MIAAQRLFAQRSDERVLDRNFGLLTATVAFGQLAGPLLSSPLLAEASSDGALAEATQRALWVAALVAALGLPSAFGLWPATQPDAAERRSAALPVTDLLRRPGVPTGLFTSLSLLAAVDLLTAYLPMIGEERGIGPAVVGGLLAVRAAASIVTAAQHASCSTWRPTTSPSASPGLQTALGSPSLPTTPTKGSTT